MNGNDAAFNSRVYLFNPSASAGAVTVRVFTLPLAGGLAQELTGTPGDLGNPGSQIGTQRQVGRRHPDTSGDPTSLYDQRRQPDTGVYDSGSRCARCCPSLLFQLCLWRLSAAGDSFHLERKSHGFGCQLHERQQRGFQLACLFVEPVTERRKRDGARLHSAP